MTTPGAGEAPDRPIFKYALVATVALVVLFAALRSLGALGDRGERTYAAALEEARLDPERYRVLIQEAERLIYINDPHGFDHHRMVAVKLANLAEEIRVSTPDGPYGMNRSFEVSEFAGDVIPGRWDDPLSPDQLQQQWERLRSSLFHDAEWFRASVPLSGPTRSERRTAARRGSAQLLADAVGEFEQIVRTAGTEAMVLPEPVSNSRSREGLQLEKDWEYYSANLSGDLRSVMDRLPPNIAWHEDARETVESLERARRAVEEMLAMTYIPRRQTRKATFDGASRHIEAARRAVNRLAK